MLRSVIVALALGLAVAGCTNTSIRSAEGQACSTNPGDDPLRVCSPAADLVCIATYTFPVTNPTEAKKFDGGIRPVYLCRLACSVDSDCARQEGDVCCPGTIYGKDYGKMAACVQMSECNTRREEDASTDDLPARPDVMRLDTTTGDRAADTASDGGAASDGASDAAPADALSADAPIDVSVSAADASTAAND